MFSCTSLYVRWVSEGKVSHGMKLKLRTSSKNILYSWLYTNTWKHYKYLNIQQLPWIYFLPKFAQFLFKNVAFGTYSINNNDEFYCCVFLYKELPITVWIVSNVIFSTVFFTVSSIFWNVCYIVLYKIKVCLNSVIHIVSVSEK